MRDWFRRWLGLEEDRRAAERVARGLVEPLWQKIEAAKLSTPDGDRIVAAIERVNASLCGNLNMIGEHLANMQASAEPEIKVPVVCPNNHGSMLIAAVLQQTDAVTGAQRVSGFGMYCPKCEHSFYYEIGTPGHRWSTTGATVEVEQGMPADRPSGTNRDPEPKRRPLRFRK